jgi:hypothetical protein
MRSRIPGLNLEKNLLKPGKDRFLVYFKKSIVPGFLDVIPFQSLDVAIFVVLQPNTKRGLSDNIFRLSETLN